MYIYMNNTWRYVIRPPPSTPILSVAKRILPTANFLFLNTCLMISMIFIENVKKLPARRRTIEKHRFDDFP